jgi:hypothetical protein
MNGHIANSAVRRRWGLCATYARQQRTGYPRRAREERRTRSHGGSTRSYLARGGREVSGSLELAITNLFIGSPEYPRQLPFAALSEAFEPVQRHVLLAALHRLEEQGILARSREGLGLSPAVRGLVDFGLIPKK